LEMLADEMGDKTAKRIMNVKQYNKWVIAYYIHNYIGFSADTPCREAEVASKHPGSASSTSKQASDHQNEGFLKSAWHKLTHQHDDLEKDNGSGKEKAKEDEEEPKKGAGSGWLLYWNYGLHIATVRRGKICTFMMVAV
jgi:molecular chaperone DnaJ